MPAGAGDPSDVRTIAVTGRDVVAAYEANRQTGREAVLRITPPYSGRMRARLHVSAVVPGEEAAADVDPDREAAAPIEIPPRDLFEDVPPYPHPDETEDDLRSDPAAVYTPERHREVHEATLEEWREAALAGVVETVVVDSPVGPLEVGVAVLGE